MSTRLNFSIMTTFLILAKDQTSREAYATMLAKERNINSFDISYLETKGSIGITDIRNFQKQIIFKPLKGENKAAIIKDAQNLTIEAQNALLKTLEEPPAHTYIFLTAESTNTFLATILSRTSIVHLQEEKQYSREDLVSIKEQVEHLSTETLGNKL